MPSFMKTVLPVLAAASTAYGACSVSGTTTIQNAGDATAMASCSTFSGSIAIATGTTDDLAFDGIEKLSGDLIGKNAQMVKRISANKLKEIDGDMNFDGLQRLYNIDFPVLKTVNSIVWNALPVLNTIGFTSVLTKADKIDIQNTGLRSLNNIDVSEAKTIFVANNGYITSVNLQLGNISDAMTFADNNEALAISLPNLTWATNLTFRFVGSLEVPKLETLNGSLGLYNNGFSNFSAPSLTKIGEALAIVANDELANLTLSSLTSINDNIQIANNTKLDAIDGLPVLESIGGAFDFSGNFTDVSTPKLDDVKGAFNLQSSENITEACAFYKKLQSQKLIRGKYYCQGALVDPGTAGSTSSSKNNGKTGAASTLSAVNGALGLAAMAAVILF
ncbi:hypothetical protein P153DRAFT_368667 [Dothidotthia symphoricarpi CBS 119687]|uniref:GPI-anchored cell wall organization protein Ecm33 n=1 Tax=Dothidotthia symphoricarpi CBS 119687 TaxID=1392245 RepID=A0A6A6A5V3_9PLEO|nr:uncharacterized protein P153DRAFT_368667 [Dothidotthia symphoricarpi CBS 119687]KAF2127362.1 hypothetical protein P153DRAFT_368667 [Dothidotthia symphoricarpi CBS 119687]